jgi:hypothetical protein
VLAKVVVCALSPSAFSSSVVVRAALTGLPAHVPRALFGPGLGAVLRNQVVAVVPPSRSTRAGPQRWS